MVLTLVHKQRSVPCSSRYITIRNDCKSRLHTGGAGGSANASVHSVNGVTNGDFTQYAVTMAPIDGLTLSGSYYEQGDMGGNEKKQKGEGGSLAFNYSVGSFSLGYGETKFAPALGAQTTGATTTQHYENEGYSVGLQLMTICQFLTLKKIQS